MRLFTEVTVAHLKTKEQNVSGCLSRATRLPDTVGHQTQHWL